MWGMFLGQAIPVSKPSSDDEFSDEFGFNASSDDEFSDEFGFNASSDDEFSDEFGLTNASSDDEFSDEFGLTNASSDDEFSDEFGLINELSSDEEDWKPRVRRLEKQAIERIADLKRQQSINAELVSMGVLAQ